ncbi:MAG TPA: sigma-70 family RNA polymerase sigma factor [Thermoleophilaceae bacterium]
MEAAAVLSDADLVARCREGDRDAWNELVERFSRYVYAIAVRGYRLSGPDAEDVFQDAFARTYEQLGRLRDDAAIRPWLAQLTRRLCVDRLRAAGREMPTDDAAAPGADPDWQARLDEALTVHQAMGGLSENCREVLDRFFCRDESYQTIGSALGLPPGTIASRISRCLTRLRERLEGRNDGLGASGGG